MCLAQGPQRSDAGEARTRGPSVSSQAGHDLPTSVNDRVISPFHEGFTFTKLRLYAKFRENKTLAKIFEFTLINS